jgi:hypothetical protein
MYVIAGEQATEIRYAFELEQLAERIVTVESPPPPERGECR